MTYNDIQIGRLYKLNERVRTGIYPDYVYTIAVSRDLLGTVPVIKTIIFERHDRTYNMHGQDFINCYEIVEDGT